MADAQVRFLVKPRFTEKPFRPLAKAAGEATFAWNDLHEHLGRLYTIVMTEEDRRPHYDTWQASKVDRQKRTMLRKAINKMKFEPPGWTEDLRHYAPWMFDQLNLLEEARNNVVHVPLQLIVDLPDVKFPLGRTQFLIAADVAPHTGAQNVRAGKAKADRLLLEYRACRDDAVAMRNFVCDIGSCIEKRRAHGANYVWPKLPARLRPRASDDIRERQRKIYSPAARARAARSSTASWPLPA